MTGLRSAVQVLVVQQAILKQILLLLKHLYHQQRLLLQPKRQDDFLVTLIKYRVFPGFYHQPKNAEITLDDALLEEMRHRYGKVTYIKHNFN